MKIALVISSLKGGGAERIATIMASYWAERGNEVTLILFAAATETRAYSPDPRVRVIALNSAGPATSSLNGVVALVRRVIRLRQAIKDLQPNAVISYLDRTNIVTVLATIALPIPVIITEHNVPWLNRHSSLWEALRNFTYTRAKRLVVLTAATQEYYRRRLGLDSVVIPNPVMPIVGSPEQSLRQPVIELASRSVSLPVPPRGSTDPQASAGDTEDMSTRGAQPAGEDVPVALIALGRLEHVKGFDLLLESMKEVVAVAPQVRLTIWGEGPERRSLEDLRHRLGLDLFVSFPGRTDEIYKELGKADMLVLSSRHEAFPNAMLEALVMGLPTVAFDCPCGPSAILHNGIEGLLVPAGDTEALATAILCLVGDQSRRMTMGKAARERATHFSREHVMQQWNALLEEVTSLTVAKPAFHAEEPTRTTRGQSGDRSPNTSTVSLGR